MRRHRDCKHGEQHDDICILERSRKICGGWSGGTWIRENTRKAQSHALRERIAEEGSRGLRANQGGWGELVA